LRLLSIIGILLALSPHLKSQSAIPGPSGVYAIGDLRANANEVDILSRDWISGYTLRINWTDIESLAPGNDVPDYDFSRIEAVLEAVRPNGKKMTLEIFVSKAPTYILNLPDTVTWENPRDPPLGGTQVVPWDRNTLDAYGAMIQALAEHPVMGTVWTVSQHPSLESIDAPVVGIHSIRELSGVLVEHPDYDRETFINAIVESVSMNRQAFPKQFGFLAFFAMDDANLAVPLDQAIYDRLTTEFNQPGKPTLGYFQETLSDHGPTRQTDLGNIIGQASQNTFVMFQALKPWSFKGDDTSGITSRNPATGFKLAWNEFGSTYVEIYSSDVLNPDLEQDLRNWNGFFNTVSAIRNHQMSVQIEASAPFQKKLTWNAPPGQAFEIESSVDLRATNWTLETSEAPENTWTDHSSLSKFYRLIPNPPGILYVPVSEP